jgi:iron complex outermembrane recepter protein
MPATLQRSKIMIASLYFAKRGFFNFKYDIVMKITITILIFICFSQMCLSQNNDSLRTYFTGEIVVSSSKDAIVKTTSTEVIDKKELSNSDKFSISETLQSHPGIFIEQNGRNEALIKLRGFDQRQIAVFFDGVPYYIAYDGNIDLSQINSSPVGKVVISKSMSSVLYGANTLGGSVNIISDEPIRNLYSKIKLSLGNTYGISGINEGKYKSLYWLLSGNIDKSDGFNLSSEFKPTKNVNGDKMENSSFLQRGFFVKSGLNLNSYDNISLSIGKNYNNKDVPVNIYTNSPRYWKYTDWNNTMINLITNFKISNIVKLRGNIYTVNDFNMLNSYDDATYTTQIKNSSFTSTYDDYTTGVSLIPEVDAGKILSSKFAFLYKRDTHYEQPGINQNFKRFVADNFTVGVEKNFDLFKTDFIVALNYNYLNIVYSNGNPLRSSIPVINGHIGIGKNIGKNIYLYAHLSNNSRFPTLKELFSELLGKNIANPNLSNEQSWNTEMGIKITDKIIGDLSVAFYLSKVKDMILSVALGDNKSQYQNIGKVTLDGFELSYKKDFKFINVNLNYTYLNAKNNSNNIDDKLEYRPEHCANMIITKSFNFGLTCVLESFYTGKRYGIDGDSKQWMALADFTIFNFRVSQNIYNKFDVIARVNNITDKYYEIEYGILQQGRNFIFGVQYSF